MRNYKMNLLLLLLVSLARFSQSTKIYKFSDDFLFGVATASYQIEGGWNESGKGENIWDRLTHSTPKLILDQSNGDIACDSFHKYKEDVQLMNDLGVDFYRFSISWTRILPSGFTNVINKDGIQYYNNLIDELLAYNITPMVTLYHWDLPQALQEIGGWCNEELVDLFEDYARVIFKNFGDRVKLWITFNEPLGVCQSGYGEANLAPAYTLDGIAPYMCGRTLLLSHAKVYHMYDKEFRKTQNGKISLALNTKWHEPKSYDPEDLHVADRAMEMKFGWWANPIFSKSGDYPSVMKNRIDEISKADNFSRSRLKPFTPEEVNLIKGTYDFFGLNYYTTELVASSTFSNSITALANDIGMVAYQDDSWGNSSAPWLKVVPWGFRKVLNWVKDKYDNPEVIITENGFADTGEINDTNRISYYKQHLLELLKAINYDGCNIKGYTAWSLIDNFEWLAGYTQKFGLYKVNFDDPNRERQPKQSVIFYKNVIKNRLLEEI